MPNLPVTRTDLEALLRGDAHGVPAEEAAVELLIAHGTWLQRPDFIDACIGIETDRQGDWFATVAWRAIPAFLEDAAFSASEGRILRIAAELARVDTGLSLAELLGSLGDTNSRLVVAAVAHARHLDIELTARPGPRSRRPWGATGADAQQVTEQDLALLQAAISDPGRYTPRGDNYSEPIPAWSARAVLVALADRDTAPPAGGGAHRCADHLDRIGHGAYPYECVVCAKRYSTLDVADMACADGDRDANEEGRR